MMNQASPLTIEYSEDIQQVEIKVVPATETPVANFFAYYYFAGDDFITEEDYPLLAQVWDNDDDAIFDDM